MGMNEWSSSSGSWARVWKWGLEPGLWIRPGITWAEQRSKWLERSEWGNANNEQSLYKWTFSAFIPVQCSSVKVLPLSIVSIPSSSIDWLASIVPDRPVRTASYREGRRNWRRKGGLFFSLFSSPTIYLCHACEKWRVTIERSLAPHTQYSLTTKQHNQHIMHYWMWLFLFPFLSFLCPLLPSNSEGKIRHSLTHSLTQSTTDFKGPSSVDLHRLAQKTKSLQSVPRKWNNHFYSFSPRSS